MQDTANNSFISRWTTSADPETVNSRTNLVIFGLLMALPILTTIAFGGVDQATWVVIIILTVAIAMLWAADSLISGGLTANPSFLLIPPAALIMIGIVQLLPLFSTGFPDRIIAEPFRATISLEPYATRLFIGKLIVYLVFLSAALAFINTKGRLKTLVVLIIAFGSIMAIFGIFQRLAQPDAIYGIRETPQAIPFGPFVNQHHFAAFMEMTAGMAFGFLYAGGIKRDKRLMLLFAVLVMGTATVMTGSRGGLLSFVGCLFFALLAHYLIRPSADSETGLGISGQQKFAAVVGSIALLILIFGVVIFAGADSSLIRGLGLGGGDVSNGRLHFWTIALKIFSSHPFLGAGFDAFGTAFSRYDTWPGIFRVEQAHNDYLQILADAGIAGLICVIGFVYYLFRRGVSVVATTNDPFRRASAIGALAGCFGILIHSFFDFPLRTPSNAFFFLLLSAVAVVTIRSRRHHRTRTGSSF